MRNELNYLDVLQNGEVIFKNLENAVERLFKDAPMYLAETISRRVALCRTFSTLRERLEINTLVEGVEYVVMDESKRRKLMRQWEVVSSELKYVINNILERAGCLSRTHANTRPTEFGSIVALCGVDDSAANVPEIMAVFSKV